ncbi:MAG: hypothetical protein J7K87_00225 [Candidatus Aenigmarchaeota archaeon]|nr:hypothetical protein [Candidatus Aenigmarchaeota archaeon]
MPLELAQAMTVGGLNLYDLIFKSILQLHQCMGGSGWGCITGDLAHDFVYTLFIPHVVLILFLFIATRGLGHRGLETLLGIGVYVFIIYSGWYPFFATMTLLWLVISLFIAGFYFFWGRVIHPTRSRELFRLGFIQAKQKAERRKTEQALREDIEYLKKELEAARKENDRESIKAISRALTERELQLRELERSR